MDPNKPTEFPLNSPVEQNPSAADNNLEASDDIPGKEEFDQGKLNPRAWLQMLKDLFNPTPDTMASETPSQEPSQPIPSSVPQRNPLE